MSPEQVEGKPAGHPSDIYSLGLIVYEMVTGEAPFKGDSALQEMYQRVTEKPKNPKELYPELPDYLVRIILRCLERDAELRYQQARDVLQDLESEVAPHRRAACTYGCPCQRAVAVCSLPARYWPLFLAP